MTSCGWVRYVEVRRGGLGWVRRCVLGFDGLRFGHGEAVLIRCVRVRFDRVRTRCGGLGMVRSVWLRSDGRGEVSQVAVSSVEDWLVKAVKVRYVGVG